MHSQALCFRFQRGQIPDGRNGKLQGWHSSRASHSVLSCFFSRLPIPSQPQTQSCSFTTSSRGLAPPKIAEFGLATWLRGVATVRGLSWSRGRCALSSERKNIKVFKICLSRVVALIWQRNQKSPSWRKTELQNIRVYLLLALWSPWKIHEGEAHLWSDQCHHFPSRHLVVAGLQGGFLYPCLPRSHHLWILKTEDSEFKEHISQ